MILHEIKKGKSVILCFGVILTGKSISFIIFMIQFQGQIYNKYMILTNKARKTCIPLFHGISTGKYLYSIILVIQGHLQGRKFSSKVKV